MREFAPLTLLFALLACCGCSREKSTDQLLQDLKSQQERERLIAVRLLPTHKSDAVKVVPALIAALQDKNDDIHLSAVIALGSFGELAREAIPALQAAQQKDRDIRVRNAAGTALSRIDPQRFAVPSKSQSAQ